MSRKPHRRSDHRLVRRLAVVALGACVAACGGGSDTTTGGDPEAPPAAVCFVDATERWGITFENACRFTGEYQLPEIMGQGVAIFDADGDGRLDLYFANAGPRADSAAPDRLFVARPEGGYRDATEESGLGFTGWSTGVAAGDLDNDGDLDLFVGTRDADRLFLNDGKGRFTDETDGSGIGGEHLTTSIALLDFDRDGLLDIFVVHYVIPDPDRRCGSIAGGQEYCGPGAYTPVPDTLYRNLGGGRFEDVSESAGIAGEASSGLGLAVADLDGDDLVDVYVANDQRPNHLWRNNGDGTFQETAIRTGVALSGRGNAEASMGVDLADVNGDGVLDIFITHIAGETNTLYLGTPGGAFRDASVMSGVGTPSRAMTAFGTSFADVDLDGDVDLLVANGRVSRATPVEGADAPGELASYAEHDQLLLNDGQGKFADAPALAGALAAPVSVSRALTHADLDGDGDLDVVVTAIGGPARVFENVAPRTGHWLSVVAWEPELRRAAVGARVEVRVGDRVHVGVAGAGWSYLCSTVSGVPFGLGGAERYDGIFVVWPNGDRETFPGGSSDAVVRLEHGSGTR